jgi:RHS repeat-associated protein
VNPYGGATQYLQDDTGRVIRQITPAGLEYEWLYDSNGKHTGRRAPFGNLVPPEDDDPNPASALAHRGPTNQSEWLCGRNHLEQRKTLPRLPAAVAASTRTDASPRHTAHRDAAGRVHRIAYADGRIEQFQRDSEGNEVAHLDTKGHWWQRQITSWDLVGAERSPLGSVTQYGYTHRRKRNLVIDPNGNRTDYVRDQAQRVIEVVQNGRPFLRYKRAAHGAILEERDGEDALLIKHEANDIGLHTSSTLASGERYRYDYDEFGNFTEASSSLHQVTQYHAGRRRLEDLRDGAGVVHSFDVDGLARSTILGRFVVRYVRSAKGVEVHRPDGAQHHFWRESDGLLARHNGNGTGEALAFDANGRLATRTCWRGLGATAAPTWSTRYLHDADGLLGEVLDSDARPIRYAYDADNRLISQTGPNGAQFEYRYDLAGNLCFTPSQAELDRGAGNLLTNSHVERFEYDSRYRLAKRVRYDATETTYTYDSADQLVRVAWNDRPQVWEAGYDGLGRRLWREYAGERTDFYWDGDRLAAEKSADGALRMYVYSNHDSLVPFMWIDYTSVDSDPTSGVQRYLFCAPTGMPLRVEDASGAIVWQAAAHEPYGRFPAEAPPPPLRLRFAGHFYDEHLELFYNRFRDYDPGLGRYLQRDPSGHAGGINLYAYAANPAASVDLRGLTIHIDRSTPAHDGGEQSAEKRAAQEAESERLKAMNDDEVKEHCHEKAKKLNAAFEDADPEGAKSTTLSVGVVEDKDGNRKTVVTTSADDQTLHPDVKAVADAEGVEHRPTEPIITRGESKPNPDYDPEKAKTRETEGKPPDTRNNPETKSTPQIPDGADENGNPKTKDYPKANRGDPPEGTIHHAEQRMENGAKKNDETVVAQSPTKPCCKGCKKNLGEDGLAKCRQPDPKPRKPKAGK